MGAPNIDPTVGYWNDAEPPQYQWTPEEVESIRLAIADLLEHLTIRLGWDDAQAIAQGHYYMTQVGPSISHHKLLNRILNAYGRKA